ncbi:hypothetical protein LOK49_LG07G00041 [Camellia lanceoleosa]|uniref:Uncharacterized protein n=1 Tax=Camellia lanceoleosa TaxID=1840588 RepID=A0ACC0H2Y7_9ERIC|nr:hypothetical protein LOK49_LG07G00041 [Camellia lanceoleosa]
MWLEIICGLVIYILCRCFFCDDDTLDVETTDSNALFAVATRLEKLYGGKVYVGLRIPDADTGSPQNIDMVLVTKGEAVVISVQNLSGFVSIDTDGSWVSTGGKNNKTERHPDPVAEVKRQVAILESYLDQRGAALPAEYMSYKVVCPNPNFRCIHSDYFPSEVVTYEQWIQLKPELKGMFSNWIKGAFRGGKKEIQESIHQKLNFILSTAPTWDRLELKGNKYLLGEFLEFKGKHEDTESLRNIRRSKVSRLTIQKTSMFGLAHSKLQVLYSPRDYRNDGASASEWKEVTVRSSTEVVFQPQNSTKIYEVRSFLKGRGFFSNPKGPPKIASRKEKGKDILMEEEDKQDELKSSLPFDNFSFDKFPHLDPLKIALIKDTMDDEDFQFVCGSALPHWKGFVGMDDKVGPVDIPPMRGHGMFDSFVFSVVSGPGGPSSHSSRPDCCDSGTDGGDGSKPEVGYINESGGRQFRGGEVYGGTFKREIQRRHKVRLRKNFFLIDHTLR